MISHDCSEKELQEHFPKGWHPMEDEIYKELQYIPSRFKVLEHHIKVYTGNAEIMKSHHIHCDETPFVMPEHSKEYMWVFHSPGGNDTHPLFLYEYLSGRSGEVLEKYLSGYKGTLVTDGYQPYHTLMKKSDRIQVAGCYAHARCKFAEIIKAVKKGRPLLRVR